MKLRSKHQELIAYTVRDLQAEVNSLIASLEYDNAAFHGATPSRWILRDRPATRVRIRVLNPPNPGQM